MSNMSYCRFQNTLTDLRDCKEALDNGALDRDELDDDEKIAAERLIKICAYIAKNYAD